MSVNEKIRLIREAKGLKQEQVALELGMSSSAYGDIERGDNDPKLSKLQKIAEIFEVKLSELVDLSDRGALIINFNKRGNNGNNNVYISLSITEREMALKDKELAMKDKEIELLKEQIIQLKENNALLKR